MPIETDQDRAVFLDPREFGTAPILFPGTPGARTIHVLFDHPWVDADAGVGAELSTAAPRFVARDIDLVGVEEGDRIQVGAAVWRVADVQPDGKGMSTVELTK